ncbi:hypothetical protein [Mycolicibacterium hippocampi]|uniref:Lipoprotein LpqN n=1 Tax=Mycolicibacterium hippocampi TaxID=659824 RepID=A0A7I9ZLF5_9MYCO|nr:hypothetical protein [Mycolicibacterium hippocampi]GFH01626.1 hypothetical protein MHIP_21090 [Mycolicibacterium hippocampi]
MIRAPAAVLLVCATVVAAGCTRTSDGVPTAGTPVLEAPATETVQPDPREPEPQPGVVPTTQAPEPAGSVCAPAELPPVRTVAQISDPAAPTATVAVPPGWSMSSGGGDPTGARIQGESGMSATVTIAPTPLDPTTAFRDYTDELTEGSAITTVSILPGDMCGFSGQRLMGILSDGTETVQYEDRIVHVPTAAQDYLIAVHVEAPSGASGFAESAALLTGDFEIGLP